MPILHTIFDTNVYRQLSVQAAQTLKESERLQSVVALAGFEPALELGARLADPSDPEFAIIWRAFAAMWHHTRLYDGYRVVVPMLHDSDSQLAWGLFRQLVPERQQEADMFGWSLGVIASGQEGVVPGHLAETFQAMRRHVEARETKFVKDMGALVRMLDPRAEGWQPHPDNGTNRANLLGVVNDPSFIRTLASARVGAAAELSGLALPASEVTACANMVVESFPTAMYFFRNLIRGMIESGTDFSRAKHANSAWDMALAFVASPHSSVDGVPSVLVTNERKFHRAAADAGHQRFVLGYSHYVKLLKANELWNYGTALRTG